MKKSLVLVFTLVILWMEDTGAEESDGFHLKGRTKRQIPKTVTVTTILEQPFAMMTNSGELEGYCVDLLSELSQALEFNYTLHVVKDGRYGSKDQNGDWNGMVGEIIRKEADLAVAPLTITTVRENVISFTKPFLQTGISILLKKESSSEGSYLFGFLNPFSKELWIGIVISYVITSLCLFLVGRLSPCEWAEPSNEQNQYTLLNSLWFGMGAFTLQGVEPQPKSVSARIIAVIWWLFSITLLAAYIASFASYVNNAKDQTANIETFDDLLKQTKVEFGTLANSSTFNFFKNSKNPTFRMIYEYMDKRKDRVLVKSFSEGVQKVRESNYAFLGESISQDFVVAKDCDLVRAPEIIGGRGYGIAASLDSPLIRPLTIAILEQFETGNLEYLRQKWWENTCTTEQAQVGWVPLQPHTLGGIFVILGIGLALGLIVSFIELVCKSKGKADQQQVAIKSIRKDRIKHEQDMLHIRRETEIMSSLSHPHIISIYEVFENSSKIVIVMEYASQGDLYDYISERQRLSEQEARRFFRQIVSAVQYCHANGIVHRDLKLENILLDENKNVKIADFGLSNIYHSDSFLQTYCGSPLYASPEIVNGRPYIGPEVDSWSLGVLLYILVHGCMPFDGQDYKKLVTQISCGAYKEPSHPSDACGLIRWLLMVNPERRATLADVASHWWVNWGYQQPLSEPESTKDSPFSVVGGWLRKSSRPLWDNGSKMRSFLRQHLPGATVTRQRSLKRSKRENMSQIIPPQDSQEKPPTVPPAPKKGILKKPPQRESGYYSSPEHSEGSPMGENDAPVSPIFTVPTSMEVLNAGTNGQQERATNVVRKGILKRNGKFSSAGAAPELSFDAVDCSLGNKKIPVGTLARNKVPSTVSQESILSTESFELLDFPTRYREHPRGKSTSMRASVSAEDLLILDADEDNEKDGARLWDMGCYRARVAESCLSLGVAEEEAMQVYRTAVLIGREPS